jgi:hypothetical protein
VTSLGLSYLFSQRTEPTSVVDRVQAEQPAPESTSPPPGLLPSVPETTTPPVAAPATSPQPEPASE